MIRRSASIFGRIAILSASVFLAAAPVLAKTAGWQQIDIDAQTIERFQVGSDASRFGPLEFVGGLEMTSSSSELGGMSAIRFEPGGQGFVGVMDTGKFYAGRIERDDGGRLSGIQTFAVAPIRLADGSFSDDKGSVDAEGVAIDEKRVLVSFERDHRIGVFDRTGWPTGKEIGQLDFLIPREELRSNQGLEAVVIAPPESVLEGAIVTVSERSVNAAGEVFAAVLSGPRKGIFFVHRDPPFDITDAAFLPHGDLLLLERRFSLLGGVGMRIRRIESGGIRPGATVDGDVLLEADFDYQIDNMEGIDAVEMEDGSISVFLISDDNRSLLQRNLLLEFRLGNGPD